MLQQKALGRKDCLRLDPAWRPKEEVFINCTEGDLLAHGTATMMIVPDLKVEGQGNLPPKLV